MNCPPTKRLRGLGHGVVTPTTSDDPFGDDEDFTQDDLNEIDIIASQAVTSPPAAGPGPTCAARPPSAVQNKPPGRSSANQSGENTPGLNRVNAGIPGTEPLGDRLRPQIGSDLEDSRSLLEAQHAELKRKLKEVEGEIVLRSGEIRVLRDSLRAAQQEKEAQRQQQLDRDAQRQSEHSEKEKELSKKVQSLQSELQFKEAEVNDMKTKLHNSDRNKMGSPPARSSPKVSSSLAPKHHGSGSSSSSPIGNGFITKEMFAAHVSSRQTAVKTKREAGGGGSSSRSEAFRPEPVQSVRPAHLQHRGGVLLGLLLQQPLAPSSLGLSHLLSMSLTDITATASRLPAGFRLRPDAAAGVGGAPRAVLSPVQSLAVTGLNMLSQNQSAAAVRSRNNRGCPGAVLLLPLLDLHLSRLCRALDSLRSASDGGARSDSSPGSSAPKKRGSGASAATHSAVEVGPCGFSLEDTGVAALRLLHILLAHSDEVVEAVLSNQTKSCDTNNKTDSAADGGLCSPNALLQSLLRLCGLDGSSSLGKEVALNAMRTVCVLTDRTPQTHPDRLQQVLQVVCSCVSADKRLRMVSECVGVLASMCDHQTLAKQLCSQHEPCVVLKLLQLVRARSETQGTHSDWIMLDLQVVHLLSRLTVQRAETCTASLQSTCPCDTELVQTVLIVFHRQWLDLRGSESPTHSTGSAPPTLGRSSCSASSSSSSCSSCSSCSCSLSCSSSPWWRGPTASLLRECLLLLHWLLLHHSNFSESCRPLLHMYDQVIPAVKDTLRRIPDLSESEELALEEICRSDGDDTEDMDTDAGS